jgi:hypothetical protein
MRVAMPNSPIVRSASLLKMTRGSRKQRVLLAAGVLGQILLELVDERLLVRVELLAVVGERKTEYSLGT